MARVKATTSDIYAKLARGECANFRNNSCHGSTPCLVIAGEACPYFSSYVKPLLDYPEFSNKYAREAKISVALNPQAKVVRKRRQGGNPVLTFETAEAAKQPVVTKKQAGRAPHPATPTPTTSTKKVSVPVSSAERAVTTVVSVGGAVQTKPAASRTLQRTRVHRQETRVEEPQLLLDITPTVIKKPRGRKSR